MAVDILNIEPCRDCIKGAINMPEITCEQANHFTNDFFSNTICQCAGIVLCDTVSVALQKLDNFLCSIPFTQYFLETIENNETVLEEFVEIINSSVDCEVILNCNTTTTTTTFP